MSDPTNLGVTFPTGDERALLQWTNPTPIDTTVISMKESTSATWIVQYQGAPVTQRYLYPRPGVSYDYKVEAIAGGVLSGPDTVLGQTLPVWCEDWAIFLADTVDPTLVANLGLFLDYTGLQMHYLSNVKTYIPMGSAYPKDFPTRARYRSFDNTLAFEIPASSVRSDGVVIDNTATINALRTMAPNRYVTMLWRDISPTLGVSMYVRITDFKEEPTEDGGWHLELVIEERRPPTYPLTSAT